MSFSPVGPFSFGSKLSSVQANQWDANIVNALDKSTAGDELLGAITMAPAAKVTASNAGNLVSSVAGGFKTTAVGGIQLAGGATDYPAFSATRSRSVVQPLNDAVFETAGTSQQFLSYFENTTSGSPVGLSLFMVPIRAPHNGATLSSVLIYFAVGQAHSGVPASMPTMGVERFKFDGTGTVSLLSTLYTFPTPGSGSAWYNGGAAQAAFITFDQNNVIDTSQYAYQLFITDETGANALNGNLWYSAVLSYTNISDMRFQ